MNNNYFLCFVVALMTLAFAWYFSDASKKVCVRAEVQTLPLYSQGPKHHIHGPIIGYVNEDVCVEWGAAPGEAKTFKWPEPVK